MAKVLDLTISEKIAKDLNIEFSNVCNIIEKYNKEIQNELLKGNSVETSLGKYKLTTRRVNNNFGGLGIAPKINIKINDNFYNLALTKALDIQRS